MVGVKLSKASLMASLALVVTPFLAALKGATAQLVLPQVTTESDQINKIGIQRNARTVTEPQSPLGSVLI